MNSLLYYSVSSGLTQNKTIAINRNVDKNRKEIYLFVANLPRNSKLRGKIVLSHATFIFKFIQPLCPHASPIVTILAPNHIIKEKVDKTKLTNDQTQQFKNFTLHCKSGSTRMEETVLQVRGEGLIDVPVIIAFIIFINWYNSLFSVKSF